MKCKCDMRTKLVGDGCEACNPQLVLDMALGAYWDAAVAEGAEGHDHDTPDGDAQRALEAVHSAVAAMVAVERERCVALIETYRVPVGNSRSGEMAAEWTLDALREVRDKIRKPPNVEAHRPDPAR